MSMMCGHTHSDSQTQPQCHTDTDVILILREITDQHQYEYH